MSHETDTPIAAQLETEPGAECSVAAPTEQRLATAVPYLVGEMAGNAVALPLDALETTIPVTGMVPCFQPDSQILGLTMHRGRAIAVLSPSLFVKSKNDDRTHTEAARIVVLRNGFGLLFSDLHYVSPAGLPPDLTALDPTRLTGDTMIPQGSLPDQVFTFSIQGHRMALRLGQLHHLKLAQVGELTFSVDIDALCHVDAPGIPVFQPSGDGSLKGEWGHILYVNLSDGTNCGFIVNDGELADPGTPVECDVFECGTFVSERSPLSGLAVPRQGAPLLLLDPDQYFAHCYSPAVVGGVAGLDSDEGAPASRSDFAA